MSERQTEGPPAGEFESLDEAECWRLLASPGLARLAFLQPDGSPDIRPVNHVAHDRLIYLRTAADSKLVALAADSRAAFETDGEDDLTYWSVVVQGDASQVTGEDELRRSGAAHLVSWTPIAKQFVVRIRPRAISGRRFAKTPPAVPPVYAVPLTDTARAEHRSLRNERPQPIAHHEP